MNTKIIWPVIGIILGILLVFESIASGGSKIVELFRIMAGVSLILGFFQPRAAILTLIVISGYLDYIKRFIVFGEVASFADLYWVLGVAPILVGAAYLRVFITGLLTQPTRALKICVGLIALSGFVVCYAVLRNLPLSFGLMMKSCAGASYCILIYLIPKLFKTEKEWIDLIKLSVIVYVPVAVYAIYQSIAGLPDFEYDYLVSGYTIEVRQLSRAVFRYYGTLNSAHALSIMMSLTMGLAIAYIVALEKRIVMPIKVILVILVMVLFGWAAAVSLIRAGWLCGIVFLVSWIAFRWKVTTIGFYLAGGTAILMMFLFPVKLYDAMEDGFKIPSVSKNSDFNVLAFQTATWKERLSGYITLQEDDRYLQPFGVHAVGRSDLMSKSYQGEYGFSHDAITSMIMHIGYIPFALLIILGSIILFKLHRWMFSIKDRQTFNITLICIAYILGVLANGLSSGNLFSLYPVNLFLWLFVSILVAVIQKNREMDAQKENDVENLETTEIS